LLKIVRLPANGVPVNFVQQPAENPARKVYSRRQSGNSSANCTLVILGAVHLASSAIFGSSASLIITGLPGCVHYFPHFAQNFVDFRQVVRVFVRDIRVTVGILPGESDRR